MLSYQCLHADLPRDKGQAGYAHGHTEQLIAETRIKCTKFGHVQIVAMLIELLLLWSCILSERSARSRFEVPS